MKSRIMLSEDIKQRIRKPLTREQEKTMDEYLCTAKRHTEA